MSIYTAMTRIEKNILACATTIFLFSSTTIYCQEVKLKIIDDFIQTSIEKWNAPGVAVAIVHDDSIIFAKGYGVRDIESKEPVNQHTIFQICSVTKTFTAVGIGMLIQDGLLDWDDPVVDHFPTFQMSDSYASRETTIRDLLSHRCGLPMYCLAPIMFIRQDYSLDEIIRRIRYVDPAYPFRSSFQYTNATFLVAGKLISIYGNKDWEDYIKQRIFSQIQMTSSFTNTSEINGTNQLNIAKPHALLNNEITVVDDQIGQKCQAAGAIASTASDMAQWIKVIINEGKYQGEIIVASEIFNEMFTPQVVIRPMGFWETPYAKANFLTYGLGWFIHDFAGEKIIEHGGGSTGYRATLSIVPERDFGLVVLSNLGNTNIPEAIRYKILDVYFGDDSTDWNDYYLEKSRIANQTSLQKELKVKESRVHDSTHSLPIKKYAGTFKHKLIGEIEISFATESLRMYFGQGTSNRGTLTHWHFNTFKLFWDNETIEEDYITFHIDEFGEVSELEIPSYGLFEKIRE